MARETKGKLHAWLEETFNDFWAGPPTRASTAVGFRLYEPLWEGNPSETSWYVLDGEDRSLLTPTHEVPIEEVHASWIFEHRKPAGSLAWTKKLLLGCE